MDAVELDCIFISFDQTEIEGKEGGELCFICLSSAVDRSIPQSEAFREWKVKEGRK